MYDYFYDKYGGIELRRDNKTFIYLQPGDDANTFLDNIESLMEGIDFSDEYEADKVNDLVQDLIAEYDY